MADISIVVVSASVLKRGARGLVIAPAKLGVRVTQVVASTVAQLRVARNLTKPISASSLKRGARGLVIAPPKLGIRVTQVVASTVAQVRVARNLTRPISSSVLKLSAVSLSRPVSTRAQKSKGSSINPLSIPIKVYSPEPIVYTRATSYTWG
jgi:hypothetical protein